jgi:hypothetical protein
MTVDEIKDLIRQANELGAYNVVFTGGEPSLLKDKLLDILQFIRRETQIKYTRIVTNAKWATTYDRAYSTLRSWKEAGLDEINISCGEYHQEFVPVSSVVNGYKAATKLGFITVLLVGEFLKHGKGKYTFQMFKDAIGEDLTGPELMSPYITRCHGMSCSSAMNYGRGKDMLKVEDLTFQPEDQIASICSDVLNAITVHPNGNTTACCGIMVREESLLNIGNWREGRLRPMLEGANQDLILNWIRHLGLRDMKHWLQSKDPTLKFRKEYINICDLCAEIVYDARCQELLAAHGHERQDEIIANKVAMDATVYDPEQFRYVAVSAG